MAVSFTTKSKTAIKDVAALRRRITLAENRAVSAKRIGWALLAESWEKDLAKLKLQLWKDYGLRE